MYLLSASHGHGTSAWPSASGMPTECRHGTNSPSVPRTSRAPRPMRVMMRIDTATYGGVGDLHADVGDGGAERAHRERDHVHRPAPHRAPEEVGQDGAHLGRVTPVVGRAGVGLVGRADVGPVLDPGDVARVGVGPVAVGPLGLVELGEGAVVHQQLAQAVVLLGGAVTPDDLVGLGEGGDLVDPCDQLLVLGGGHGLVLPPRLAGDPSGSPATGLWIRVVAVGTAHRL